MHHVYQILVTREENYGCNSALFRRYLFSLIIYPE